MKQLTTLAILAGLTCCSSAFCEGWNSLTMASSDVASGPGEHGRNVLIREGKTEALPSKCNIAIRPGDVLRIETPGGGGLGASSG